MVGAFTFTALPARVLFGSGRIADLPQELEGLGCRRLLLLSTPGQRRMAEQVAAPLGDAVGAVFAEAAMHTPVQVTERAMAVMAEHGCDGVLAVGGGSTIGLGKAIALRTDLPQIVVPTTYAGSEVTAILGETRDGGEGDVPGHLIDLAQQLFGLHQPAG